MVPSLSTLTSPVTVRCEEPLPVRSFIAKTASRAPPGRTVRFPCTTVGPLFTKQIPLTATLPYEPASTPGALGEPEHTWVAALAARAGVGAPTAYPAPPRSAAAAAKPHSFDPITIAFPPKRASQ